MVKINSQLAGFTDFLLPISAVLFLFPISPSFSSIPAIAWVIFTLINAPNYKRWALWPIAFATLVMTRTWLLNEMNHPAAAEDLLLVLISFLAASGVLRSNFRQLLSKIAIALPIILMQFDRLSNTVAGRNQTSYLIGLIGIVCICYFSVLLKSKYQRVQGIIASLIVAIMLLRSQSRAAIVATIIAFVFVWLIYERKRGSLLKMSLFASLISGVVLLTLSLIRPSDTIQFPAIYLKSDMGRLQIQSCYLQLPFSGENRFIYGIGFENPLKFCQHKVASGVLEHSHNIYIQIWANSGMLGAMGLLLFLILIVSQWRKKEIGLDPFLAKVGLATFVYILTQCSLDASIIYWPVTQVYTGIMLAIPFTVVRDPNMSTSVS